MSRGALNCLTGCVTDNPGRPLGNVGGKLILRFVTRPSAMRRGASNRDLHACQSIKTLTIVTSGLNRR